MALAGAGAVAACGGGERTRSEAAPKTTPSATATTPAVTASEGAGQRKRGKSRKSARETTCAPAKVAGYRLCEAVRVRGDRLVRFEGATIEVRDGDGWRVVAREPRGAFGDGNVWGAWTDVWISPDGRTLLAQWSGECETAYAFFIRAEGGAPRSVTGRRDRRASPLSRPRGWARDGRARVWVLPGGGCSHETDVEPGRYLVDPRTRALERVGPLPKPYRR